MQQITLRLANVADAEEIAAVFRESRAVLTFLPDLHSAEEDLGYVRDQLLGRQRVTVAVFEGRIVGFMAEADGWINQFYIDARQLRAGIGSALLADAQARNDSITLWCFAENSRARSFYEKHGFVAVEFTNGSSNEAKAPDVRYRWMRS